MLPFSPQFSLLLLPALFYPAQYHLGSGFRLSARFAIPAMILLYRETPHYSRHKKRSIRQHTSQTLLFLFPSTLHILRRFHLLRRLSAPLRNLRLFLPQLFQDGHPAVFLFTVVFVPVNKAVILFFPAFNAAEVLAILHIFLPVFKGWLSLATAGRRICPGGYRSLSEKYFMLH